MSEIEVRISVHDAVDHVRRVRYKCVEVTADGDTHEMGFPEGSTREDIVLFFTQESLNQKEIADETGDTNALYLRYVYSEAAKKAAGL